MRLARRDFVGYLTWSLNAEYIYYIYQDAATQDGVFFHRVRVGNHKLERVASMNLPIRLAFGLFGPWTGLDPEDVPLLMRDTGIQEIYALGWQVQ